MADCAGNLPYRGGDAGTHKTKRGIWPCSALVGWSNIYMSCQKSNEGSQQLLHPLPQVRVSVLLPVSPPLDYRRITDIDLTISGRLEARYGVCRKTLRHASAALTDRDQVAR